MPCLKIHIPCPALILDAPLSSIWFLHKRKMIWVNDLSIADEICQKNANAAKCRNNVKCGHFCSNARGNGKLMINLFLPKFGLVSGGAAFASVSKPLLSNAYLWRN